MPCASLDFLLLNIVLMKWSENSCDFLTLGMLENKAAPGSPSVRLCSQAQEHRYGGDSTDT